MAVTVDADAIARLRTSLIRISRRIDRQVSVGGLTSTEVSVLASIANRGPLGLAELASHEGINRTMLSRVVGKLEAAELIRRQASIADRRAVEVVATRKGGRLRERLLAERSRLLAERLAELPGETVATILDAAPALEALAAALEPRPVSALRDRTAGGA
jgi:DNA-binding MarR family transcriptional regulator